MRKDITGQRCGKLLAIRSVGKDKHGNILWECQCDCGNIVYASAGRLQYDNLLSCGCLKSRGERKISEILTELDIPYSYQHKFPDCKSPFSNLPLYFDFYLPDYNCCIEYDGEQHFCPIDYFGGVEKFEKTKLRDKVKTDYCDNHQIKLIRIPYLDYNILDKKYLLSRLISEEGI